MSELFGHNLDIEKLAAFFDGNLSSEELNEFEALMSHSDILQELVAAGETVDETIAGYGVEDLVPPSSIETTVFDSPLFSNDIHGIADDSFISGNTEFFDNSFLVDDLSEGFNLFDMGDDGFQNFSSISRSEEPINLRQEDSGMSLFIDDNSTEIPDI